VLDTASIPVTPADASAADRPELTPTGSVRLRSATGAIRTLGANPATAPVMLHPGDAIPTRRRVLYIILLGALTALGPFTIARCSRPTSRRRRRRFNSP